MSRKFLMRYVTLILLLLLFAGAAWYVTEYMGEPYEDAVLVSKEEHDVERVQCAVRALPDEEG